MVEKEEKGVTVEESRGKKRRRHKDDVKMYQPKHQGFEKEKYEDASLSRDIEDSTIEELEEDQVTEQAVMADTEGEPGDSNRIGEEDRDVVEERRPQEAAEDMNAGNSGGTNMQPHRRRQPPNYLKDYVLD